MGFLGTDAPVLSDVSLIILLVAAAIITQGWRRARSGEGTLHHRDMIIGVVLAWLFFLAYMLRRVFEAGVEFPGPEGLKAVYWYPLITIHSLAATVTLVWSIVQIRNGYKMGHRIARREWDMTGERRRRHAHAGRGFLTLWYVTTVTGVLVYLSLYVFWRVPL